MLRRAEPSGRISPNSIWQPSREAVEIRFEVAPILPPQGAEKWPLGIFFRATNLGTQARGAIGSGSARSRCIPIFPMPSCARQDAIGRLDNYPRKRTRKQLIAGVQKRRAERTKPTALSE
jgi:hypothetical protein